jgi:hypothetical protein
MEVEDAVKINMKPPVKSLERSSGNLIKDVAYFKANIGDDMVTRVKALEASLKAFESHAGGGNEAEVTGLRTVLVNTIMPALRNLRNLYMVATKGPGQALRPGPGEAAGEHLTNRISVLETALKTGARIHGAMLSFKQRI